MLQTELRPLNIAVFFCKLVLTEVGKSVITYYNTSTPPERPGELLVTHNTGDTHGRLEEQAASMGSFDKNRP